MRHHTSRAGDPHRHLHLQINARVLAEGQWRGLHTVGVRDSIDAINGIGHAAMMTDPGFRRALAQHGFTLDPSTARSSSWPSSSVRSAPGPRRSAATSTATRPSGARPTRTPSPARRCGGRGIARAWADARPDKVVPRDGAELTSRWVDELHALGYREPAQSRSRLTAVAGRSPRPRRRSSGGAGAPRVAPLRRGTPPTSAARSSSSSPGRTSSPSRRCGSSWPRTSPPAPSPTASRCSTARACPSMSGR